MFAMPKKKSDKITNIEEKLKRLKEHKIKYETIAAQIEQSSEPQVSTTDPDSRALLIHGQVVEEAITHKRPWMKKT